MIPVSSSAEPNSPFITLEEATLRRYDRLFFRKTDWTIRRDEHWAIIGPNGSGKTTLALALCGRVPVVEGALRYHFLHNGSSLEDEVAYVALNAPPRLLGEIDRFHQARWHSHRSRDGVAVEDFLSIEQALRINPYQVLEWTPDPAVFAAHRENLVRELEIEPLMERHMLQLSNGERRKVMIAQALLKRPRLLILDSPFSGLDEAFRAKLKRVIQETMRHVQVIVVTAARDEVPEGITHALLVEDGRIITQGPREPIVKQALTQRSREKNDPARSSAEGGRRSARPTLVEMHDVSISFNGHWALEGIDWMIREGENWALLGPNGAGKSTLLSLITGDNPQVYANDVRVFGRARGSGESVWQIKARIGWMAPELLMYYPRRTTCFDVVGSGFFESIGRYRQCSPSQRDRAERWMERLDVLRHADTPLGAVSAGERRLVLLARAVVKHPQLLILDEPCQGLDAAHRSRVLDVVDEIGHLIDTSVIYVTHNPEEMPRSITHILKLARGRVIAQRPASPCQRATRERSRNHLSNRHRD